MATYESPRSQAWADYCRADEHAATLLNEHVNAGGSTPCESPDYKAADEEASRLYRQYIRNFQKDAQ